MMRCSMANKKTMLSNKGRLASFVLLGVLLGVFASFAIVPPPKVSARSSSVIATNHESPAPPEEAEEEKCKETEVLNEDCSCKDTEQRKADCSYKSDCTRLTRADCGIINYLWIFINVLSGIVGIVVASMIIIAGIQYSASKNDPAAVAAAKQKITNAVTALVMYIFLYSFLQWLVPGGIF
ncbi:hypothetical protein BH23PAT1_BH23PAT1_4190 [soil metagenome]